MKKMMWLLILTILLATTVHAGEYSKEELEVRFEKFRKMKRNGYVMAGVGVGFMVAGFIMMQSADWEKETDGMNTNYNTSDSEGGVGILLFAPGIPLTVVGIILGSIGSNKTKRYQELLDKVSVSGNVKKDQIQVSISLSF
jgi:hypothetical protein